MAGIDDIHLQSGDHSIRQHVPRGLGPVIRFFEPDQGSPAPLGSCLPRPTSAGTEWARLCLVFPSNSFSSRRLAFLLTSFALALGCGDGGSISGIDGGPRDGGWTPGLDGGADFGTVDSDGEGGVDVGAPSDGNLDTADTADAAIDVPSEPPFDAVAREIAREPDVARDAATDSTNDVAIGLVVDAAMLDANQVGIDGAPFLTVDGSIDGAPWDSGLILGDALDGQTMDVGQDGVDYSVIPSIENGIFTFTTGTISFGVDRAHGARIVTYALGGTNVVTTPASDPSNYGSTFWPSPQSAWNWPPPAEIDSASYAGAFVDGVLTLASATSASLGLAVSKQFSMDARTGDVLARYSLVNQGTSAHSFAPWEITRVAPSGLVFFPMGAGGARKGSQDLLNVTTVSGVAWFSYDASVIANDQKLFADGAEGWIAYENGGVLLIKSFADIALAQAAPSEAEIEIFANAAHTHVEVENQGACAPIPAGGSSTWSVRWFLRAVPASIPVAVGSAALVDYARSVIAGS